MLGTPWQTIDNVPLNVWLRTKREGEQGEAVCYARIMDGLEWAVGSYRPRMGRLDEIEWVDNHGYTTLINPGSMAPPTHWASLEIGK